MKQLKQVEEFSILYGFEPLQADVSKASIKDFIRKRYILHKQEKSELKQAVIDNDLVELADGIADVLYIALGSYYLSKNIDWLHKCYLRRVMSIYRLASTVFTEEQFERIFNEVHRSNMSKACKGEDTAMKTMACDKYRHLSSFKVNRIGNMFAIYSNCEDLFNDIPVGKLLKSVDYSPADLSFVKDWNIKIR